MKPIGVPGLALTFAGCFLGAGYVSGQELWQYFGAFGARGIPGLLLAIALLGALSVVLLRLAGRTGAQELDALLIRAEIPWLRLLVGAAAALLLFGVVCIMCAGIGALCERMLGLPAWVGSACAVALVALCAHFGVRGMVTVFTFAVPCLVAAALAISALQLHRTGLSAVRFTPGGENPMLGGWASAAVNYAAYNFFATVGILAPLTPRLKRRAAGWGVALGCGLLLAIALSVLCALATDPAAVTAQLPMLDLACALGAAAGAVYAALLFLAMFGTSVSSLVAVLAYAGQKSGTLRRHSGALLCALALSAFAGSLFGFGDLIGVIYPVYGYLGAAAMLLVAEHALHEWKKRRPAQAGEQTR